MENLINWKQVSRTLAGNETSIRKNKCPQKYVNQVETLKNLVKTWHDTYVYGEGSVITITSKEFIDLLMGVKE